MTAIHIAGQQSTAGIHSGITAKRAGNPCFAAILQRNCLCAVGSGTLSQIVRRSLLPAFLHTLELLRRNDLQFGKYFRYAFTASQHAGIGDVDENILNGGIVKRLTGAEVDEALLLECGRGFPPTIAILICQLENAPDSGSLHRVYLNVKQLPVLFAHASLLHQLIAIGRVTATESTLHDDLPKPRLGTNGGLDTFAGRLPVTDVVQQLVHMVVKPLLAFLGAPNLDSVVDEPFHDEGRFVIAATQPVKHENKKDVKCVQRSFALDLLYSVALLGRHFEAGDAFFGKLSNNVPAHLCGKLMTPLFLHGDVVFFDLLQRGNTVQAANSFAQSHAPLRLERPNVAVFQNRSDGGHGIISRKRRESEMHMESIYLQRYHVFRSGHMQKYHCRQMRSWRDSLPRLLLDERVSLGTFRFGACIDTGYPRAGGHGAFSASLSSVQEAHLLM